MGVCLAAEVRHSCNSFTTTSDMAQLSLLLLLSALQPITISGDQILRYSIQEDLIPGTFIGNVKHDSEVVASFNASVMDSFMFGTLPGPYRQHFLVEETTGILRLSMDLDRDQICPNADNCVVSLEAAITWPMEYFRPIPIQIELLDLNDNAPQFPRSSETIQISENALTGSSYMLPTAVDPDSHSNRIQHYRLMPEMEMFSLNVDPVAGSLSLVLEHSVDREIQDSYSLQLLAQDGGQPPLSGILDLQIQIVDSNDNVPTFVQRQYNVSLQEDQDPLTPFLQVQATDPDEGLNGEVVYTLAPQTADSYGSLFSVDSSTGELSLQTALDYQMGDQYQLVIMARDQGQDSQQSYVQVYIYVRDVNNHAPEISASPVANNAIIGVKENLPGGAIAAIISVQDQDLGDAGRCDCVVMDTNFSLEPLYQNGFKLVTRRVLDRETAESYVTVVECQDNGTPALSSSLDVRVNILDDNDNPPVFSQREYRVGIQENEIGSLPVIRINASDLDAGDNGRVTYNLDSRVNSVLAIDQDSGVIRTKRPFDREAFSEYRFSVYANDNGEPSRTATAWVILNIQDVNDEAPRFTQTVFHFSVAENQKNNSEVGAVMAEDADSEPYNQFRFTLDGSPESLANFRIHATRGMITTRKVLDREQHSSFSMLVVARNSQPPFLSSSATVTIYVIDENDNPPTISFPNPSNNRTVIQVSSYAPVGQSFTRITASDMDMGTNAKLQYKISNYGTPFGIDSVTGEIIVQTALDFYSEDRVVLYVEVSDEGQPPLSTRSTVHLHINRSVEFAQAQGYLPKSQGILGLGQHEEIILVLGSVTGVLIILLVAAIIFVRKRQLLQRKQLCHYAESLQLCPDFTGRSSGSDAGCEVTEVEDDRPPSAIASRQPSVRGERGEPLAITTNQVWLSHTSPHYTQVT